MHKTIIHVDGVVFVIHLNLFFIAVRMPLMIHIAEMHTPGSARFLVLANDGFGGGVGTPNPSKFFGVRTVTRNEIKRRIVGLHRRLKLE